MFTLDIGKIASLVSSEDLSAIGRTHAGVIKEQGVAAVVAHLYARAENGDAQTAHRIPHRFAQGDTTLHHALSSRTRIKPSCATDATSSPACV